MKEELISFETAKLAEEKGWKFPYTIEYLEEIEGTIKYFDSLPTQSLLQRWLREKHAVHIEIYANGSGWGWILTKGGFNGSTIKDIEDNIFFDTYEQALEAGLLEGLKLIK